MSLSRGLSRWSHCLQSGSSERDVGTQLMWTSTHGTMPFIFRMGLLSSINPNLEASSHISYSSLSFFPFLFLFEASMNLPMIFVLLMNVCVHTYYVTFIYVL